MSFQEIEKKFREAGRNISNKALKVLAIEGERSFRKNFDEGGRPVKWEPSKRVQSFGKKNPDADVNKSAKTLVLRGYLKNITGVPDTTQNKVVFIIDPRARLYAKIHNEGGNIIIRQRKVKMRTTTTGAKRFASSTHKKTTEHEAKAHTIKIPKREFFIIPKEDYPRILNAVSKVAKV